jgi:hypothetical protein
VTLLWGIFGDALTGGRFFASDAMSPYVVQGVMITFAAVILLSQTQDLFQGAIRRFGARYLSLRLGTAYPIAHRFRTGLTLGMYSLVIFTLVFVAILTGVFSSEIEENTRKISGGFDVLATSSTASPPGADALSDAEGVERVVTAVSGFGLFDKSGSPIQWWVTGIDSGFVAERVPTLKARWLRMATGSSCRPSSCTPVGTWSGFPIPETPSPPWIRNLAPRPSTSCSGCSTPIRRFSAR